MGRRGIAALAIAILGCTKGPAKMSAAAIPSDAGRTLAVNYADTPGIWRAEVHLGTRRAPAPAEVLRAVQALDGKQVTADAILELLVAFSRAPSPKAGGMTVSASAIASAPRVAVNVEMLPPEEHGRGYSEFGGFETSCHVRAGSEDLLCGSGGLSTEYAREGKGFDEEMGDALRTALSSATEGFAFDLKVLVEPPSGPLKLPPPKILAGSMLPDDVVVSVGDGVGHLDCLRIEGTALVWRVRGPDHESRWRKVLPDGAVTEDARPIDPCDLLSTSPLVARDHDDFSISSLRRDGTRERLLVPGQPPGEVWGFSAVVRDGTLYYEDEHVESGVWALNIATGAKKRLADGHATILEVTSDRVIWVDQGIPSSLGAEISSVPRRGGTVSTPRWVDQGMLLTGVASLRVTDAFAIWVPRAPGGVRRARLDAAESTVIDDMAGAEYIVDVRGNSAFWLDQNGLHETDYVNDRRVGDWTIQTSRGAPAGPAIGAQWLSWVDPLGDLRARRLGPH